MPSNQLRDSVLILVLTFLCLVAPTSLGDVFAAPADTTINNLIQAMLDRWDLLDFDTHNLYKQIRVGIDELREILRDEPFKHNNLEPDFCAPEAA